MSGWFAGSALAATVLAPEEQPTLAAALAVAQDGDTITVGAGTWAGVFVNRSITIAGTLGSTVIQDLQIGGNATVTLEGLTLEGVDYALEVSVGDLVGTNLVIHNNVGMGGLYGWNATITLNNCSFEDNVGYYGHVGLDSSALTATDVVFVGGEEPAIDARISPVTLVGAVFDNVPGFAVYASSSDVVITDSTFLNTGVLSGYAGSTLLLENSAVMGNPPGATAIVRADDVQILGSTFDSVDLDRSVNATAIEAGEALVIVDSTFTAVNADEVVWWYGNSPASIEETTFNGCSADTLVDLAPFSGSEDATVSGATFLDNDVELALVYSNDHTEFTFADSVVRGNESDVAMVFVFASLDPIVTRSLFCDNEAAQLLNFQSTVGYRVKQSLFGSNALEGDAFTPGVVVWSDQPFGATTDIVQNTFVANTSDYVYSANLQMPGATTFLNNLVLGHRGEAALDDDGSVAIGYSLFWDNVLTDLESGNPLPVTNLSADPQVRVYRPESACAGQDPTPRAGSPAIDNGDPAIFDDDGSRSDIGWTGGSPYAGLAVDLDADGASAVFDCDDTDSTRFPGTIEGCDAVDSDCDGDPNIATTYADVDQDGLGDPTTAAGTDVCALGDRVFVAGDCDDGDPAVLGGVQLYFDFDFDGVGMEPAWIGCPSPGVSDVDGDCDDANDIVFAGANEECDGEDNDCNGVVDDDLLVAYPDADGDGFGVDGALGCGDGFAAQLGDCDDGDSARFPGAPEVCNHTDDDCDGQPDNGVTVSRWVDVDGDGFGALGGGVHACDGDPGVADVEGDCDDGNDGVFPGADEVCNHTDDDCDGNVDEELTVRAWADGDGDGIGDADAPTVACDGDLGVAGAPGDCDDDDPNVGEKCPGCGCRSAHSAGSVGVLLAVALGVRRRRI